MGLNARKPVFGVSDQVMLKQACSATETSYKIEILRLASLDMILSNKQITKALIRQHNSTSVLEAAPGKLDIKSSSPSILYDSWKVNKG